MRPWLVVRNTGKCRPVERQLTEIFWSCDAAPYPANLSNPAFGERGRIRTLVNRLEASGFVQRPVIARQQEQQSFVEVFPSPALVTLFPGQNRREHIHCRALRYKFKKERGLGGGPQRMGNLSGTVTISGMPGTCPKILARGQEADRDRYHRIQGRTVQTI